MDKVKINLFGESWSLKELELTDNLKSKIDHILSQSSEELSSLLLDLSFYEELGIPEIKSIADLPGTCIKGLQNTPKSQLEIWLNGKKILKTSLQALFNQNTLFKLYHSQETTINFEELGEGIYLFEQEMGLVACYQFTTPKFNIDRLVFRLLKFRMNGLYIEILTEIFWGDNLLISKRLDLLLTSSSCYKKTLNLEIGRGG